MLYVLLHSLFLSLFREDFLLSRELVAQDVSGRLACFAVFRLWVDILSSRKRTAEECFADSNCLLLLHTLGFKGVLASN